MERLRIESHSLSEHTVIVNFIGEDSPFKLNLRGRIISEIEYIPDGLFFEDWKEFKSCKIKEEILDITAKAIVFAPTSCLKEKMESALFLYEYWEFNPSIPYCTGMTVGRVRQYQTIEELYNYLSYRVLNLTQLFVLSKHLQTDNRRRQELIPEDVRAAQEEVDESYFEYCKSKKLYYGVDNSISSIVSFILLSFIVLSYFCIFIVLEIFAQEVPFGWISFYIIAGLVLSGVLWGQVKAFLNLRRLRTLFINAIENRHKKTLGNN